MGIIWKVINNIQKVTVKVFNLNSANIFSCRFIEKINPIYSVKDLSNEYKFYCPNDLNFWRATTFFLKEPETLKWIDTFKDSEVFFDIGANVGLYSIYAAKKGIKVFAFEPESQNYSLLNKNVYLNNIDDYVFCLNIAVSDKDALDLLYIPKYSLGGGEALNSFGEPVDWDQKQFVPAFKQGVLSFSIDSFLTKHSKYFPNHIKIDVDGIEPKIINGLKTTLSDKRLKSILVEINEGLEDNIQIINILESFGFQVNRMPNKMWEGGKFRNIYNYIFSRI